MSFKIETKTSEPIPVGDTQITISSRAWQLRLAFGGIVWNHPAFVAVQAGNGQVRVLPVYDVTRIAQALILALGLAGAIWIALTRAGETKS